MKVTSFRAPRIIFAGLFALTLVSVGHAPAAWADTVLGKGSFIGQSNHTTSGSVSVLKTDKGTEIRLGANFSLDGAPDPWVGFGKGGVYDKSTQLVKLKSLTGAQTFSVPASVDVAKYDQVFIWCSKFSVPLGVARIN